MERWPLEFQRGEYDQAEKYAEAARATDSYNAAACVNLSACSIVKNDLDNAKGYLLNALEYDPNHVQALYNLGTLFIKKIIFFFI